jgi:hypothetical protein
MPIELVCAAPSHLVCPVGGLSTIWLTQGACKFLEEQQVAFQKKPSEGSMRGLAFALDPDGYWVEIIGRGLRVAT